MDLFDYQDASLEAPETSNSRAAPLAHRMRPRSLDDFVGQEKILGPGRPLRQWIATDRLPSMLFWGPPGCGKTTLAQIIAQQTHSAFVSLSAVLAGVKEIKETMAKSREVRRFTQRKTVLFLDEIHRFNKSQQDALLPHVEDGTVTLIGATTENPSFEMNSALLSRVRVIRFERLNEAALVKTIQRALLDPKLGLGGFFSLTQEAILWLAQTSDGDARRALTALETLALFVGSQTSSLDSDKNPQQISTGKVNELGVNEVQQALEASLKRQPLSYDKAGEEHYNVISAFIKSMRASDPDAGLYYLARMLEGGEDPLFIARRMVIFASEDIGNADPRAIMVAVAAKDAVEFVGLPEGRINLAQAVTYLAMAPKSRASYDGIERAIEEVQESGTLPVPFHLRNKIPIGLPKPEMSASTQLPEQIAGKRFYFPTDSGLERQLKERLDRPKR